MQETFRELVNRVLQHETALAIVVKQRLNERYRQVVESRSWSWLRKESSLTTPAEYSTGTAAVTAGSMAVVGTGTAWAPSMNDRVFRIGTEANYYTVTVTDGTNLTLDAVYEGSTGSGLGYKINQNRYSLAADMDKLLEMYEPRAIRPLQEVDIEWLNAGYPSRPLYGDPMWYAYVRTTGGTEEVELFPLPTRQIVVRYAYISGFVALAVDSDKIPEEVRADALVFGTLADMADDQAKRLAYGRQFQVALAEMVAADLREGRVDRVSVAQQYIGHRRRRRPIEGDTDWLPWTERPY